MWKLAAGLTGMIMVGFLFISRLTLKEVRGTGPDKTNPLGVSIGVILAGCAALQGLVLYMLIPALGASSGGRPAIRADYGLPLFAIEAVLAAAAVRFWLLRHQIGGFLDRAPPDNRDIQALHRRAVELNDNIVQGLAFAKYALDDGDDRSARLAVAKTLRAARAMITEVLMDASSGKTLEAGQLRRSRTAESALPRVVNIGKST